MTFKRYTGSVWTDVTTDIKRYTGSAWTDVNTIKRYDGSQWQTVWSRISWLITDRTVSGSDLLAPADTTTAYITFGSDGVTNWNGSPTGPSGSENWVSNGTPSDYTLTATTASTSGTASRTGPSGWTSGGTVSLGSVDRTWTISITQNGQPAKTWELDFIIKDAASPYTQRATGTITLSVVIDVL